MKLVVNSNINYKKPLSKMIESLINSGFKKFDDVIVVMGQCENDEGPRKIKISEISGLSSNEQVTLIKMKLNNFDYTGYHALHLHSSHPLVISDWYMYVLDTVTFTSDFLFFLEKASLDSEELLITKKPHSNICAFGCGVVNNYGDNFGTEINKDEAIRLEFEEEIQKNIKGICSFGRISHVRSRVLLGNKDIYKTGFARRGFYYPDFGINKWIFWGSCGDITGSVSKNNPFKKSPQQ